MKYEPNISKKSNLLSIISLCVPVLFLTTPVVAEAATAIKVSSPVKVEVQADYGKLPLSFEANSGQTAEQVKFLSRGNNYTLFLTPNDAVLALSKPKATSKRASASMSKPTEPVEIERAVFRMALVGSNQTPELTGKNKLPGKSNYFVGKNPEKWRRDIPTYSRVQYKAVYPGIDLVYYGNQMKLEYDFIVAPGADPGLIKLNFSGADKVSLDDEGNLILQVSDGEIIQNKPYIYQEIDGAKKAIQGNYSLSDKREVSFDIAAYDSSEPLVIDPVLVYSTYLGGSGYVEANHIAVDDFGNAYVTGRTSSVDFPTVNPVQAVLNGTSDIFVSKLNSSGSALIYSTYLGGSSSGDYAEGIAVDSAGNAVVGGSSQSDDFPTVNPLQAVYAGGVDAVVFKLDAQGSNLIYSTYLGGSSWEYAWAVAVDDSGNAYLTGETYSSDFPTMNPFQPIYGGNADIFVSKISSTGSTLVYSTFLGGSSWDNAYGIDADSLGNAYLTGETNSANFPTVNPIQAIGGGSSRDAFVSKFNPAGSALIYSTYLGGSSADQSWDIAADASGNAYLTGFTTSTDFPTVNPLQATLGLSGYNGFVSKLSSMGNFIYSTYFGGDSWAGDNYGGIDVDASGNVYVTGGTGTDLPIINAPQPTNGGGVDAFVSKLNDTGSSIVYSTYLGGSGYDHAFSVAVTPSGIAYITGWTHSIDFPTVNSLQPSSLGYRSGFIAKISTDTVLEVPFDIAPQICPNLFNSSTKGKFPAAIPGTVDFDLALVDPATLRLAGVAPLFTNLDIDEATPFAPYTGKQSELDCTVAGADGLLDLRLKFDTLVVVAAIEVNLGRPVQSGEVLILPLTGQLYDGTPIIGEDVIVIK